MRLLFSFLFFSCCCTNAIAQQAQITVVEGKTDFIVPLLPPLRSVIQPFTIELELKGKLDSGRKDTAIYFRITDRTKSNKPELIDSVLVIEAAEWPGGDKPKKIKREIYIRHQAIPGQKFTESAEVFINTQPNKFQTIRFLESTDAKGSAAAVILSSKAQAPTSDTLFYSRTFGYANDAELLDLKVKKYADRSEIKVCNNKQDPTLNKCVERVLLGEISREKFTVVLQELLKLLPTPGSTLDTTKMGPYPGVQFSEYSKFLATKKPKDSTEAEKQSVAINKKLEQLFNENSNKKAIGYFKLANTNVPIHRGGENNNPVVGDGRIVSVEVVLANGAIRKNGLKVILENGQIYRNKKSPITLYRLDRRKGDLLYVDDSRRPDHKCYNMELGDVLNYIYQGKFSYPGDGVANLTPDKKTDTLSIGSTVSELVDVSIFSDMLALLGRKPNGIIQTQATATFITNTGNVKDKDMIFHNFVKAYFRLAKFDSKFAQIDTSNFKNNSLDSNISRLYLHQIAYLQAGLKTNLVRIGIGNNQQIFLNAGAEINLTNADSIFKKDIVSINYYPEIEYSISRLENFGLEASFKYIWQSVSKNAPFKNKETVEIINPQVIIYYYPFSSPDSKIYVRYAHYAQIGDAKYNYPQFQFGFKTNLFGKKEKSE